MVEPLRGNETIESLKSHAIDELVQVFESLPKAETVGIEEEIPQRLARNMTLLADLSSLAPTLSRYLQTTDRSIEFDPSQSRISLTDPYPVEHFFLVYRGDGNAYLINSEDQRRHPDSKPGQRLTQTDAQKLLSSHNQLAVWFTQRLGREIIGKIISSL